MNFLLHFLYQSVQFITRQVCKLLLSPQFAIYKHCINHTPCMLLIIIGWIHGSRVILDTLHFYTDAPEVIASNSSSYEILSGERLHLQCGYVGVPTPSLQWHHNGTVLGNGSNSVRIINDSSFTSIMVDAVKLNSGGTYTCRATNVLGSGSYDYTVMVAVHGSSELVHFIFEIAVDQSLSVNTYYRRYY